MYYITSDWTQKLGLEEIQDDWPRWNWKKGKKKELKQKQIETIKIENEGNKSLNRKVQEEKGSKSPNRKGIR